MEAGEREYTYLSMSGHYLKFFDVFRSIFYRTLWQAGIAEPRKLATDEDREFLLNSYRELKPRPGIHECFSRLRAAGFTVWALTAGDTARVAGYLAQGGVEMPENNFVSCDTIKIGKPAPESYKYILDKFENEGREAWFAAAHMWDAAAAKRTGYVKSSLSRCYSIALTIKR
jgi:2-haloacid dehalogenase